MEEKRPAYYPKCHFHGADPIDTTRIWVGLDPMFQDIAHSGRISLVTCEQVGLARGNKPLQSRNFPRELHIAGSLRIHEVDVAMIFSRPRKVDLVVFVPVDGSAKFQG